MSDKYADDIKTHYDAFDRCMQDVGRCTQEHLAAIEKFFNDPQVREIYEYHMNNFQEYADQWGLGAYFTKLRFFADLIFMMWGFGFTVNKIV